MSERPSSPGHLGGPAAQAIVQKEKLNKSIANFAAMMKNRPALGMSVPSSTTHPDPTGMRAQLRAEALGPAPAPVDPRDPTGMRAQAASKKGGKRKNRKSRKTRKSKRSNH